MASAYGPSSFTANGLAGDPAQYYPPQSASGLIEPDYSAYSDGKTTSGDIPLPQHKPPKTWARRDLPLICISAALTILLVHSGLSCTTAGAGKAVYSFGWTATAVNGAAEGLDLKVGAFFRMECSGASNCTISALPNDNWGSGTSPPQGLL